MRLIHAPTLQLKDFVNDIPDYVILSHTWGNEEVTFADFNSPHAQRMEGYEKLRRCCEQATQDGFEWAWLDTACIDKSSSAELTESLNSMFNWYRNAALCYAYLSDISVSMETDKEALQERFRKSRWFTRGWTLQELLAPAVIEFYDSNWTIVGTKSSLLPIIAGVTKIHETALQSPANIGLASAAQKFSWAASRETSREEDTAYCLLGLFNVNMPLLYGEGKRAFFRLQQEIMKTSNDHTLFAWEPSTALPVPSREFLANGPDDYRNSGNVRMALTQAQSFTMTNRGLQIGLPCIPIPEQPWRVIALLNCYFESSSALRQGRVGVLLDTYGTENYHRVQPQPLIALGPEEVAKAQWKEMCIVAGCHATYIDDVAERKPWVVSLSTMPSFDTRFQVRRLAKCGPEFKDGQFVAMEKPADLEPAELFIFGADDFAGILFQDMYRSFLLAFGQRRYGMIWLIVRPGVLSAGFDKALKLARVETAMDSDLHRDAADAEFVDGSVVAVRAKKIRRNGTVGWQILIDTSVPSVEADTAMVDEPIDQTTDLSV
jgi:uncharacterized protein YerC